jgi:Tfp pilus assembly protein PilX
MRMIMQRENLMNAAVVSRRPDGERGVALLIALLSLMVLTLLGLTLAATTSTELQIASNYRWSQQALYNAEAGVEAGKVLLRGIPNNWAAILPPARGAWKWDDTATWVSGTARRPPAAVMATGAGARHWENNACDAYGMEMGYGVVLQVGGQDMQYVSTVLGNRLNGAFTLWVRRPVNRVNDGTLIDETRDDLLTLTSEGIAPTVNGDANAAIRVFEVTLSRAEEDPTRPCFGGYRGQNGGGITGDNYSVCSNLAEGGAAAAPLDELMCRQGTPGTRPAALGNR